MLYTLVADKRYLKIQISLALFLGCVLIVKYKNYEIYIMFANKLFVNSNLLSYNQKMWILLKNKLFIRKVLIGNFKSFPRFVFWN